LVVSRRLCFFAVFFFRPFFFFFLFLSRGAVFFISCPPAGVGGASPRENAVVFFSPRTPPRGVPGGPDDPPPPALFFFFFPHRFSPRPFRAPIAVPRKKVWRIIKNKLAWLTSPVSPPLTNHPVTFNSVKKEKKRLLWVLWWGPIKAQTHRESANGFFGWGFFFLQRPVQERPRSPRVNFLFFFR